MKKKKPLVRYAVLCRDGNVEAYSENIAATRRVVTIADDEGGCGPHRVVKLVEEK